MVRHQVSKFLLRNERRLPGKTTGPTPTRRGSLIRRSLSRPSSMSWLTGWRRWRRRRFGCAVDREAARVNRKLASGSSGESIPVAAWCRVRNGRDAGGRSGRLPTLARAVDFMGYVGLIPSEQTWQDQTSGTDHEDRQYASASRLGGGGVALPTAASDEQGVARA